MCLCFTGRFRTGFRADFEKRFGPKTRNFITNNQLSFFQFQAASNFVFANVNTNRAKSDEFALVGVNIIFMYFFVPKLYLVMQIAEFKFYLKKVGTKLIYIYMLVNMSLE